MIKAVWLDVDNTLLDFDAYVKEAMKNGFAKYGLGRFDDEVYAVFKGINDNFWHRLEKAEITYEELLRDRWNTVFAALGISYDGPTFEKYFKGYLTESAIPVEGSIELLDYLKEKYPLCAASNGPFDQQMNRLRLGGLVPYFSHFFISGAIGAAKPARAFFEYGMKEMNDARAARGKEPLRPDEVMLIGDSLSSDMAGACAFGMRCCLFNFHKKEIETDLPIDHTVRELKEICEIL